MYVLYELQTDYEYPCYAKPLFTSESKDVLESKKAELDQKRAEDLQKYQREMDEINAHLQSNLKLAKEFVLRNIDSFKCNSLVSWQEWLKSPISIKIDCVNRYGFCWVPAFFDCSYTNVDLDTLKEPMIHFDRRQPSSPDPYGGNGTSVMLFIAEVEHIHGETLR